MTQIIYSLYLAIFTNAHTIFLATLAHLSSSGHCGDVVTIFSLCLNLARCTVAHALPSLESTSPSLHAMSFMYIHTYMHS